MEIKEPASLQGGLIVELNINSLRAQIIERPLKNIGDLEDDHSVPRQSRAAFLDVLRFGSAIYGKEDHHSVTITGRFEQPEPSGRGRLSRVPRTSEGLHEDGRGGHVIAQRGIAFAVRKDEPDREVFRAIARPLLLLGFPFQDRSGIGYLAGQLRFEIAPRRRGNARDPFNRANIFIGFQRSGRESSQS